VRPDPEPLRVTDQPPLGGPRLTAQPPVKIPAARPPREHSEEPAPALPKFDVPAGLDEIRKHWNVVVAAIRRDKPGLAPLIGAAEPSSFENDILKLKVPAEGYSIARLNDSQTRGAIASCVAAVFGTGPVGIEIEVVKPAADGGGNGKQPQENLSAGSFEQLCKSDPLMGKIKELFDPELLD